jgi:ABC-2 type transport system ATP-binding protein
VPHAGAEHELERERDEEASCQEQHVLVTIHRGHSDQVFDTRLRLDETAFVGSPVVPKATPAVEVAGLGKRYGDVRAVDGVSLTVGAGEVFGLLGPNGAGKTTTVEILEGYRRADAGEVRVLDLDPWRDGARLRPKIGVMLQDGGLYPGIRPLEALALFASYYDDTDDPQRLLDVVGLRDAEHTLVRRMSGGQYQRLSLALALIGRPSLVFLDEPTAGLDPRGRATTWELVRELRDSGVTVVLTTHAMDEAEQLCSRLAIIDHGRVVGYGTPAELTAGTVADETRFSARPSLDRGGLAVALGLDAGRVREPRPGDYVVDAPATPALIAALAAWLRDHDVTLGDLHAGRGSLEEVFLRLTSEDRS